MGWAMMTLGLSIALASSALLFAGVIESGVAAAIGNLGIRLDCHCRAQDAHQPRYAGSA